MSSPKLLNYALLFFILNTVLFFTLSAQDNIDEGAINFDVDGWKRQQNVIPPSPDAASLGQYGNTSVSYFTGEANINIPLQGIGGKFVASPISLSYSANSIKVATVPSWVGLGWTLQAGGVITRSAQGMPDTYNFFTWKNQYPELSDALDPDVILHCNNQYQRRKLHNRVAAGDIDLKPDVFYFNFPGGSGSFIFDDEKNMILRDRTDLLIEPSWNGNDLQSFTITTVNGIQYVFGGGVTNGIIEHTEHTSGIDDTAGSDQAIEPQDGNPKYFSFNSAWYLISITSPGNAETITYHYDPPYNATTPYALPINIENDNSVTYSKGIDETTWSGPVYSYGNGTPEETNPKIFNRRFLSHIILSVAGVGETDRIDFSAHYDEPDPVSPTTNGMQLDTITVSRRWQGTDFIASTKYFFKYSDVTGRLTLDQIQEVPLDEAGNLANDMEEATKPPYVFTYAGALPPFLSNAIDLWGYYNGANSNDQLIPSYDKPGHFTYNGANRTATGATDGLLSSISYPTGGRTSFEYDSHRAGNLSSDHEHNFGDKVGGLRLRRIIDYDGLGGTALTRTFNYITEDGEESGILFNRVEVYAGSTYEAERPPGTSQLPGSNLWGTSSSANVFAYNGSNFGFIQGSHIGYSRVEEVIGGIGKNVYTYKASPNGQNGWKPRNGRLLKKQVYGNATARVDIRGPGEQTLNLSRLDREEIYTYGTASEDFTPLYFYETRVISDSEQYNSSMLCQTAVPPGNSCNENNQYEWRHYAGVYDGPADEECIYDESFKTRFSEERFLYTTTWTRPQQTKVTDYFYDPVPEDVVNFYPPIDEVPDDWNDYFFTSNGRSVTQITNYEYDRTDLTLATAISRDNSDGTIFRTEFEFFANVGDIRAIPFLITKKAGGTIYGGTRSVLDNRGWPNEIYELTDGGGEVLRATIASYTSGGQPQSFQYMNFPTETYTWTQNLVTQRNYGSWTWTYDYNEKRLLTNQVEIDGQEIDYTYDPYNRLKVLSARQGSITKEYDYLYGGPNEVVETTIYTDAPTQIVQNQFDGLGRPVG
ncbi:MAG: hypothetical protein AAFO03_27410, partial [Bacteroidota bacterium]